MSLKQAILFFVKYPTPGKVKTRLAKTVGFDKAARIYRQLAEENFAVLKSVDEADLIVMFDPPEDEPQVKQWLKEADYYFPQQGLDLGARLSQAFLNAFDNGYQRVIVVGSDILGLTAEIIEQSFVSLATFDIVIGPAHDGGYYLLGSHQHYPQLFSGISWSTEKVFHETCQIIKSKMLACHILQTLKDLDE